MRSLLAVLIVLALLLVGADFAGRLIAQQRAGQELHAQLKPDSDPSVRIHGFSFLIQAARGSYSHISITEDDVTLGPIDGAGLRTDLYGVGLPLSDLLGGTFTRLTAARAELTATIPAAALGAALHQPGISVSTAAPGTVRIHTTITVSGNSFPVTVDAAVSASGRTLRLTARPVSASGVEIPQAAADALQHRLTTTIPLGALPFPLNSATVSTSDGDLVVSATATQVDAHQLLAAP